MRGECQGCGSTDRNVEAVPISSTESVIICDVCKKEWGLDK